MADEAPPKPKAPVRRKRNAVKAVGSKNKRPLVAQDLEKVTKGWHADTKLKIIEMYLEGFTMAEICGQSGKGEKEVRKFINGTLHAMLNMKQTRMLVMGAAKGGGMKNKPLMSSIQKEMDKLNNPELINEEFFKLLSPPDSELLTDAETKFCWSFAASFDYEQAMFASGLDAGLYTRAELEESRPGAGMSPIKGFEHCLRMRIAYLKTKPNLCKFIKEIQQEVVFQVDIGKDFLQKEIMLQIDRLKNNPSLDAQKLMRDYLQMLGKTFGGFVDKLEVGEIDHAKTIEKLIKQSKKSEALSLEAAAARAKKQLEEKSDERAELAKGTDGTVQ